MVMTAILEKTLRISPVIPVVAFNDADKAIRVAQALLAGGIGIIEVTLRTPNSLAALEAIAKRLPEMCVGAGTVRYAKDVASVKQAGARFVVSPGFSLAVSQACNEQDLPLLPGISTATEAMAANDAGHQYLKLFPAEAVGGVKLLKALHGPFPDLRFCPTGGITQQTAVDYLALPNVVCIGGSWLVSQAELSEAELVAISQRAREVCSLARP